MYERTFLVVKLSQLDFFHCYKKRSIMGQCSSFFEGGDLPSHAKKRKHKKRKRQGEDWGSESDSDSDEEEDGGRTESERGRHKRHNKRRAKRVRFYGDDDDDGNHGDRNSGRGRNAYVDKGVESVKRSKYKKEPQSPTSALKLKSQSIDRVNIADRQVTRITSTYTSSEDGDSQKVEKSQTEEKKGMIQSMIDRISRSKSCEDEEREREREREREPELDKSRNANMAFSESARAYVDTVIGDEVSHDAIPWFVELLMGKNETEFTREGMTVGIYVALNLLSHTEVRVLGHSVSLDVKPIPNEELHEHSSRTQRV